MSIAYRIEVSLVREEWDDDKSSIEQEEYLKISPVLSTSDEEEAKRLLSEIVEAPA